MSPVISGVGIHSGRTSRVHLHRSDGPIRFRCGSAEIPALVGAVVSADRCVVLAGNETRVATVEHLLAALHIAGFWSGVLIEVDGEELPILDGSAGPWAEPVASLGTPPEAPPPLVPTSQVIVRNGDASAELVPGAPELDVSVDYPHPAIGSQRWRGGPEHWPELLDARTFGFLAELESLRELGLASGANAGNAIVFDDSGPLRPLRHRDEPVRHKALDLLGDLALLGRPLGAAIRVNRGSHRLHVNLMRQLLLDSTTKVPA
jgi:UDP-3-O-[3-hydroxymyristoyl] N-acetylglucosamine deacetylase